MKNICENCQHWAEHKDQDQDFRLGTCKRIGMFWERTDWVKKPNGEWIRTLSEHYKNDKAFAQDGSDYRATLETMPDFGCVQFEPTAPPNYFPDNPESD